MSKLIQERKVISNMQLPSRLPIGTTIVTMLAGKAWSFPDWGWGVVWTLLAILWVLAIIAVVNQKSVEIDL